jgi:predicted dehydrogenase
MSEKMVLGIIGVGVIGKIHAKAHQAAGQTEIAAICDVDAGRLAEAGEAFGVEARFGDYKELLKTDVEAVAVCVGNALHREVALAAIRAGKHVFLEKPMALNATEAAEIAAAVDKADSIVQLGMVNRFQPPVEIIREWVESGRFGNIYHMRVVMVRRRSIPGLGGWFTTRAQSGGGPLIDLGVHGLDMAMYLSGLWNPTSVSAGTYAEFGPRMGDYTYVNMWSAPPKLDGVFDVEDYATGLVRFGDQATLSFEFAWAGNSAGESYVEVLGNKAGVRALDDKPLTILTEHAGRPADITPQLNQSINSSDQDLKKFELQARSFAAACRGQCSPAGTVREGLVVMELIDAIYASSAAGAEVAVNARRSG